MPKANKSALLALAAAGGLWAWRNRDKIQGMINSQINRADSRVQPSQPMTGETQRIDTPEQFDFNQRPKYDSSI